MIELLSKPIDEIGTAEIQALIDSEVPEGEQIEFKKEPPAEGGKSDPWMNDGKIGNYAKDRILKEVVAFANAYGGVLVIGIDESDTKPAVATSSASIFDHGIEMMQLDPFRQFGPFFFTQTDHIELLHNHPSQLMASSLLGGNLSCLCITLNSY